MFTKLLVAALAALSVQGVGTQQHFDVRPSFYF